MVRLFNIQMNAVKASREAKMRTQTRWSSNSAPALAQVTTVPGPTVQAANIVQ